MSGRTALFNPEGPVGAGPFFSKNYCNACGIMVLFSYGHNILIDLVMKIARQL